MKKVRKIPQRQCIGCRVKFDKRALLRVVRSPEGEVSLDFHGKKPGRGAYVCCNAACLKRARKSRALERMLSVSIPPEVYDALESELRKKLGETGETDGRKEGSPAAEKAGVEH